MTTASAYWLTAIGTAAQLVFWLLASRHERSWRRIQAVTRTEHERLVELQRTIDHASQVVSVRLADAQLLYSSAAQLFAQAGASRCQCGREAN